MEGQAVPDPTLLEAMERMARDQGAREVARDLEALRRQVEAHRFQILAVGHL